MVLWLRQSPPTPIHKTLKPTADNTRPTPQLSLTTSLHKEPVKTEDHKERYEPP